MRLIDADALREILEDGMRNNPHKDGYARVCHRSEYTHFLNVIQRMPTIAPPPNDPLTLDELRKMDGEPVYVTSSIGEYPMWYIVDVKENELKNIWDRITLEEWDEGYPYRAYRRKPEEGTE